LRADNDSARPVDSAPSAEAHPPMPFFIESLGQEDTRRPRMEIGLGIWTAGTRRYNPVDRIRERGEALIDELDGRSLLYVDPTGGAEAFEGLAGPDLVLITDVHGDHMDAETLQAVVTPETEIVAPAAVVEELPEALAAQARTLANGEETMLLGLNVEAIPMYNLTEERLQYHEEGRGNGYVVTMGGTRVYIAGDTEDIPEMRQLEDIDVAFVPFNLPFTMTAEQAADAVLAFEPDIVYPYHYRGSDVDEFARLVTDGNPDIEVRRGEWY